MAKFKAVHKITMTNPNVPEEFSGRYRSDGEPIMRRRSMAIRSGEIFELSDAAEIAHLRKAGAICDPDEELSRPFYNELEI